MGPAERLLKYPSRTKNIKKGKDPFQWLQAHRAASFCLKPKLKPGNWDIALKAQTNKPSFSPIQELEFKGESINFT